MHGPRLNSPRQARANLPFSQSSFDATFLFFPFSCDAVTYFSDAGAEPRKEMDCMETLHEMLVEDEILFCALVLIFGMVIGAASRSLFALRARRSA